MAQGIFQKSFLLCMQVFEWVKRQIRLVRVGARRGNPLFIGIGSTKLFFAGIAVFALLPQRTDADWSWRIWSFLTAPPNEIGDTLAGVAGALAFLWIIVTVMLQSKELAAQREELRLTRIEMSEQKEATQELANTANRQNFDNFVFEMIASLNSIVGNLDIQERGENKPILYKGRDCFGFFYRQVRERPTGDRLFSRAETVDETLVRYDSMFNKHSSGLSQYFRYVYNMLRVLDEAPEVQPKHRKLVRSLFSDDELLVLFYNALTERGKNFVPYIESFELFDNLPLNRLASSAHRDSFTLKCFGASDA
ncbi:putative phage abortive infection protein [Shimia sagamensis]|uniref:Phage abortive infection protein n=1 Tax=Shimia sagamensis TaxID=1566352 RepID=A0ABY1N7T6_9RHOB|nr:putative phage abortive infection protein [Shimia sagamensis]SMP02749.1 Putative phage abortive infection protein [Shimia sagamensis]